MRRIVARSPDRRALFARTLVVSSVLLAQLGAGIGARAASAADSSGCQLEEIAFCDTFDAPSPNGQGTRSGDLDGVVWGVSRATSDDNPPQGNLYNWHTTRMNQCGTAVSVASPRDVQICNGQLVESVNDGGGQTVLAMYPRQPFDFAGRTGKVVFDVSNDTQGTHMAWPEFVLTDQPVPAPFEEASGLDDYARNSFGIQFSAACQNGALVQNTQGDSWTVNGMFSTSNYVFSQQHFTVQGCVKRATDLVHMNHIEVSMSPTHVEVWATDPGDTALKQLATADVSMPLTRGLVWMEDAHYNANKDPGTQRDHTFAWDNFGFDGPILPRDLGFDVLDATHSGTSGGSLGYFIPSNGSLNLQIPDVHDVENAGAALLEFTWWPHQQASISYSLNGNPSHTVAWPYANQQVTYKSNTLAVALPLNEVLDGANTVTLSSSQRDGVSVANIDLILVGAGGTPAGNTTGGAAPVAPDPASMPAAAPTDTTPANAEPTDSDAGQ